MRNRSRLGWVLLLGAGLLAGCGQKGPLVLPTKPAATPAAAAHPTPPAPAAASTAARRPAASTSS